VPDEPKIIIDSDWKSQAQAEKQKLAAAEEKSRAQAQSSMEPVRFDDIVGLLASGAMQYMGYMADPQTGRAVVSLEYAKLHIDMLSVLEEKTKGNLSEQESATLSKMLNQLRLDFVDLSKVIAKAVQEGKVKPVQPGGAGVGAMGGGPIAGAGGASPIITG
jgi:hypothetical protein